MKRLAAILLLVLFSSFVTAPVNPAYAESPDTIVLVIDASGSMSGPRIEAVVKVGNSFLDSIPKSIKVGLVTFNSTRVGSVEPTLNYSEIRSALQDIVATGDTALYDGIISGIALLPKDAPSRLVVLTDGDDTASKSLPDDVINQLEKNSVNLDIVTVGDGSENIGVLEDFVLVGQGRLVATKDANDLIDGFTETLQSAAPAPSPSKASPAPSPSESISNANTAADEWKVISRSILVAFLIFVLLMILYYLIRKSRRRSEIDQAIEPYLIRQISTSSDDESNQFNYESSKKRARKTKTVNSQKQSTLFPNLSEALENANVNLSAESWILLCVSVSLVLGIAFSFVTQNLVASFIVAAILVFQLQKSQLKSKAANVKREFEDGLADFLSLVSSGLRSGMTFGQAVTSAAVDGSSEVERQVRRAVAEVSVGAILDDALLRVAHRMESDDLIWTISALRVQREVGGNLSKILDTAVSTIRGRAELKREIRTLSAEGRISAYVLVALPIGVFLLLVVTRRDYVQIFWSETIGQVMLGAFAILVLIGWNWVKKIVTIEP